MPTQSDRILITGGSGMLAFALAGALRSRGIDPMLVSRAALDITDEQAVGNLFKSAKPTVVINCAAYTKVDLAERETGQANAINGHAVGILASACRAAHAALVHFSTDYVFDGSLTRPLRVDDPVGPVSAYGTSKLIGEQLLAQNAPERWLIIRTAWLFGPMGPCFPATILNAARQNKPLSVIDDQTGTPTFTFDLAQATLELIDKGAQGILHVTNSGQTSWYDFAAAILQEFSLATALSRTTSARWKEQRPDSATRPRYSVLNLEPVENLLGRRMPDWRDALHRYRLSLDQVGP